MILSESLRNLARQIEHIRFTNLCVNGTFDELDQLANDDPRAQYFLMAMSMLEQARAYLYLAAFFHETKS